jgi:hypothetical protein
VTVRADFILEGSDMSSTVTLGRFVLQTAQGNEKVHAMPAQDAKKVCEQLFVRISTQVEEIHSTQRRAFEDSKSITVF